MIERHRNGETVDNALLEKLVESLVALGIDEADINRQNLEVYKEAFERPFIAATELYYRTESEAYIADNSVNDYMKKAEQRLKEEEQRVDMYLHPSSRKIVRPLESSPLTAAADQHLRDGPRQEPLGDHAGGFPVVA